MLDMFPDPLAIFPLSGAVLMPGARMPLNIFEPRYLQMVEDAISADRVFGMIQPKAENSQDRVPALFDVGCVGEIVEHQNTSDGRILINLEGHQRFRVGSELSVATPYRQIRPDYSEFAHDIQDRAGEESDAEPDHEALRAAMARFLAARSVTFDWAKVKNTGIHSLINLVMVMTPFEAAEKQALLEAQSLKDRVLVMITLIDMLAASPDIERPGSLQ